MRNNFFRQHNGFSFYLNYEECKYNIFYIITTIEMCFILTMRNVNLEKMQGLNRKVRGFILTMRNVNSSDKTLKIIY